MRVGVVDGFATVYKIRENKMFNYKELPTPVRQYIRLALDNENIYYPKLSASDRGKQKKNDITKEHILELIEAKKKSKNIQARNMIKKLQELLEDK